MTENDHGVKTGDFKTIAGCDQAGYNGTYVITVTGGSSFTIPVDATAFGAYSGSGGTATRIVSTIQGGAGAGAGGVGSRWLK